MIKKVAAGVSLALLVGCAGMREHRAPAAAKPVYHVVMIWLKERGNAEQRRKILAAGDELRKIPGVLAIEPGAVLPSDRPEVDDSFDLGIVFTFADEAALAAYQTHPAHVKAVHEILLPNVSKILVYDFQRP